MAYHHGAYLHFQQYQCIVLFTNFSFDVFCEKLVGQHPKTFNNFKEIGYALAELNITLSWKARSGFFGFPHKSLPDSF